MEYFTLLHLQKEPFSNSPDPEMFFQSTQHQGCLQKLELAIRLKRGLSVVVGDMGTGKSTLCRQLIKRITRSNSKIVPHLILDPEVSSPLEFLTIIASTFGLDCPTDGNSVWQLKESIKDYLFEQAMQHQKVPVLILDEGQKLPAFGVEILREFLSFETNQHKLLQIVIFAQGEFQAMLKEKASFADRIAWHFLRPLNFQDTRAMIVFRLRRARVEPGPPPRLFSQAAFLVIYWLTQGYPRRIVMLCSKIMVALLVHEQQRAGVLLVLRAAREGGANSAPAGRSRRGWGAIAIAAIVLALVLFPVAGKDTRPTANTPAVPRPLVTVTPASPQGEPPKATPPPPMPVPAPPKETPPVKAVPVPIPAEAAPVAEVPATLPADLGTLEVDRDVSLSKMVARIYGRYTAKNMALVLRANRRITNPNHVAPKTMITFPVPPKRERGTAPGKARLQLTEVTELAAAYKVVKEYPETAPPLLIIPLPSAARKGIDFHVVLEEAFADENSARKRIKALPPAWRDKAQAVKIDAF